MPRNSATDFTPGFWFKNKHFNTLYRYFSTSKQINYQRQRFQTQDNDFIDLDIASVSSNKVIIAIHGLEGSSNSSYIKSLVSRANQQNYDVIAFNLRGCSGEPNLKLSSYHSGKAADLHEVIQFVEKTYRYESIFIVGYSLGGNMTIKYMGEYAKKLTPKLKAAVAVSAPCDLKASAQQLSLLSNRLYQANFLKSLKAKAKEKMKRFPKAKLDKSKILKAKSFYEFDHYFTAPTHGFLSANDYWKKSSSKQFIKYTNKPVLLISALDDPFLRPSCYPFQEAEKSNFFSLLTTKHGGHVGFYNHFLPKKNSWLETKILNFLSTKH